MFWSHKNLSSICSALKKSALDPALDQTNSIIIMVVKQFIVTVVLKVNVHFKVRQS